MTRFAERDEYQVGTLVNGLPTCVFHPKPYNRIISNIVVSNTATGPVYCYRGILGGTPVAQNLLGSNNTMRGDLEIPAGQSFFVQWTVLGTSVRDATARVSWERNDNPLVAGPARGEEWASNAISSLVVPSAAAPNDAAIVIGEDLPPCMQTTYASAVFWRPPGSVSVNAPWYFMAQTKITGAGTQQVDTGYLWYNGTDCGYAVNRRASGFFFAPNILNTFEQFGRIAFSGVSFPIGNANFEFINANVEFDSTVVLSMNCDINWNGCDTLDNFDATNYNSASVTYVAAPQPDFGQVFKVPPSGRVLINFSSWEAINTNGHSAFMTIQIREGNTLGAGTISVAAADANAIISSNLAGNPDRQGSSYLFNNGVAGNEYNVQLLHRTTGALGSFQDRYVVTQPVF